MLLEVCCRCGFVHKDARTGYRAYKPHYHWFPDGGAVTHNSIILHATICVACLSMDWKEFFTQKALTSPEYRVKYSLNAPLPERYLPEVSKLYREQAKFFVFDS